MMNNILIVSPHFPPVNAPDHQRVRMILPYLKTFGWNPTVLAVDPHWVRAPLDQSLLETLPEDIPIERVRGIPPSWTQPLGFDNIGLRCLAALNKAGSRLLSEKAFQMVFFSTTQHTFLALGPEWKKRFGVPFVVDVQDPIVNDYYARTQTPPPGGKWKYRMAQFKSRKLEKTVMSQASYTISVSPDYLDEIQDRVSGFSTRKAANFPFPYSKADEEAARLRSLPAWLPERPYLLSAGRGGKDLEFALRGFFRAMSQIEPGRQPATCFVGTSYGSPAGGRKPIEEVATEYGLRQVFEISKRQAYLDVVAAQSAAQGNCVFGSMDPRYQASKLIPLLAMGRPVLAVLHRDSPAVSFLERNDPEALCAFDPEESEERLAGRIRTRLDRMMTESRSCSCVSTLAEFEAEDQARRLGQIFQDCMK